MSLCYHTSHHSTNYWGGIMAYCCTCFQWCLDARIPDLWCLVYMGLWISYINLYSVLWKSCSLFMFRTHDYCSILQNGLNAQLQKEVEILVNNKAKNWHITWIEVLLNDKGLLKRHLSILTDPVTIYWNNLLMFQTRLKNVEVSKNA